MSISKERVNELVDLPDSAISTFDIPEANEDFFRVAELRLPKPLNAGPSVRADTPELEAASAQVKGSRS